MPDTENEQPGQRPLDAFVDDVQAVGRYWFATDQARHRTRASLATAWSCLERLKGRGRLAGPPRGFHVIVPLEYRSAGAPPVSWFIDALMEHLGHPYYVGLLGRALQAGPGLAACDRGGLPSRGRCRVVMEQVISRLPGDPWKGDHVG